MDKQAFIYEVSKHIRGRRQRAEVQRELAEHLREREQFYLDAGFDAETAEQKAITRMGDAEVIGSRLSKVHGGVDILRLLCIVAFVLLWMFSIYLGSLMLFTGGRMAGAAIMYEYAVLLSVLFFAFIAVKKRCFSLSVLCTVRYTCFLIAIPNMFLSGTFSGKILSAVPTSFVYLVSGKWQALGEVIYFADVKPSGVLIILSGLFYAAVLGILCFSVFLKKHRNRNYLLYQTERRVLSAIFAGVFVLCAVQFGFTLHFAGNMPEPEYTGVIHITAADEISQPDFTGQPAQREEISAGLRGLSTFVFVWGNAHIPHAGEVKQRMEYRKLDALLSYKVSIREIEIETEKKYVFIAPAEAYSDINWLHAGDENRMIAVDNSAHPMEYIEFSISKK